MRPDPLDEYPIHQSPLSMARVDSSDRNFYDRYYFNGHDRTGDIFFVTGFGTYANLGVLDAFATVRRGDVQRSVRFSDAIDARSLDVEVGGYRIEVVKPLQTIRVICEHPDLSADMVWEGAFPSVLEEHHVLMAGPRPSLDATRFAQVGSWSGTLRVDGTDITVDPAVWTGTRDRSWGIRPVGEREPLGRLNDEPVGGFWWSYIPLRFDDFALMIIAQEGPDGHRTLNHATRIFPDGRVEQLGWPRFEITYRSGTRTPEHVRIHLTDPIGEPLVVDIEPLGFVTLQIGSGYGSDPEWNHGQWRGRGWSSSSLYDLTDPTLAQRVPHGTNEHIARATCNGAEGWGMFEHGVAGRHDPSGFADGKVMAP
ncbi:hypothetical protein [Prescottella subtropica]|uniref:hypothetical protein n=1 Tax=Prescottella subtropica TaxID=2545757 RepID=UPI0010F521FB|nr:hypothetical protein [Prescottella subtropica]